MRNRQQQASQSETASTNQPSADALNQKSEPNEEPNEKPNEKPKEEPNEEPKEEPIHYNFNYEANLTEEDLVVVLQTLDA